MAATTKHRVAEGQRRQVLELRRRHSLREVASITGLPLGTVKAIASRSGVFRDNARQRELFSLPPIKASAETLPSVLELPPQQAVTGDAEVDALLWLREVINTGQAALIERAMEAAKRIRTPLAELAKRYRDHLTATQPGNLFAALMSFNMEDLEGLAAKAIERERRRIEGAARFGDALLLDTEAERFCIEVLAGLKADRMGFFDKDAVAERFNARPELLPHTLADCLHELDYWRRLYWLRNAVDRDASDSAPEAYARECFVFGLLALIRPRDKAEALAVLRYLLDQQRKDDSETDAILANLIG